MVVEFEGMVFEDELVDIMKHCSEKKMWRGTIEERKDKFRYMHDMLNQFYHKNVSLVIEVTEESDKIPGSSGLSHYRKNPFTGDESILLSGRLSVVTLLHEWGHAIGCDQMNARKYSLGLFKCGWPNSYNNLKDDPRGGGLVLKQRDEIPDDIADSDNIPPLAGDKPF